MRLPLGEMVEIYEVGPRDGLQNEKRLIPALDRFVGRMAQRRRWQVQSEVMIMVTMSNGALRRSW